MEKTHTPAKTEMFKLRVTREFREKAKAAAEAKGSNLSEEVRGFMSRLIKKHGDTTQG